MSLNILIASTETHPNNEETSEISDDYGWDIDRWENDGGRSIGTKSNLVKDRYL